MANGRATVMFSVSTAMASELKLVDFALIAIHCEVDDLLPVLTIAELAKKIYSVCVQLKL